MVFVMIENAMPHKEDTEFERNCLELAKEMLSVHPIYYKKIIDLPKDLRGSDITNAATD